MDFQSAMETFAEAWVAANAGQQSQALALTRVANAAAAAAANAANVKTPTDTLHSEVIVKKEHSPSPSHSRHTPINNAASTSLMASNTSHVPNDGSPPTPTQQHRRNSLQGVQDKLAQLHQLQQQQQQQQQQQNSNNEEQRSPRYVSGGLSTHTTTPSPHASEMASTTTTTATSSQHSTTPKLSDRDDRSDHTPRISIGSITCLPPSALNAVAAAAAATSGHQTQSSSATATLSANSHNEKLLSSPASAAAAAAAAAAAMENRRDFDVSKVNSKSLPLHCVVESVHSLQASLNIDNRSPWKRRPNVETDSYVIIAAATPWSEIVQTALQRLGYSQETAATARGSLIIKNWKPITLEQISDNPMVPVCDIIGELTSVVTLRIVILRCKPSPFGEIKDKLLKLLVLQSHALLRSTGCPLDEVTLSQICRSSYQSPFAFPGGDIPEEIRRKFDQWWSNQLSPQSSMAPKLLPFMAGPPNTVTNDPMDHGMGTAALAAAAAAAAAAQAGLHAATSVGGPNVAGPAINAKRESLLMSDTTGHHPAGVVQGTAAAAHHANMIVHPAMHASMHHHHHHSHHSSLTHSPFSNQKTRMRTSFDPEMELPRLQKWFQENPHPSRQQIQSYVVQLNALESRRGRKPLDVNNVVYWFKNARAAQKRAEMRGGLGVMHAAMNGYLSQHGQLGQTSGSSTGSISSQQQLMSSGMGNLSLGNEFMKSPLSLKSEDIDTISQHSDDLEEDNSRPGSPQLPLSLTMHERHHVRIDHDQEDNHNESLQRENLKDRSQVIEQYGGETINPTENAEEANQHSERNESSNNKEKPLEDHQSSSENVYGERQILKNETDTEGNNSNNSNTNNNNNNANPIINLDTENHHHQLSPQPNSPKDEDDELDMDEDDDDNDVSQLDDFRSPSPSPDLTNAMMAGGPRKDLPFPMVPNSMFSQSFMYMSHYMPGFGQAAAAAAHPHAAAAHHAAAAAAAAGMQPNTLMGAASGLNLSSISSEERRKRNRTFIDPVTEVPKLEQWFAMNTHPSHNLILKYTEDLNTMPYRQKFPRLESKNVQFWFKNRRAKCKRLKMSLYDNSQCSQMSTLNPFVHKYEERD